MNNKNLPWHYIAKIGGFFIFLAVIFFSLIEPQIDLPPEKTSQRPDFKFDTVQLEFWDNGILQWKMDADTASLYKKENKIYLKDMQGRVFINEQPSALIDAKTASYHEKENKMIFNNAQASYFLDQKIVDLIAPKLIWDLKKREFLATKNIEITSQGIHISGDYFHINLPSKTITLSEKSKAIIETN